MKAFFINLLRLLSGRISFERRARLLSLELAAKSDCHCLEVVGVAQEYYYFALTGGHIRGEASE